MSYLQNHNLATRLRLPPLREVLPEVLQSSHQFNSTQTYQSDDSTSSESSDAGFERPWLFTTQHTTASSTATGSTSTSPKRHADTDNPPKVRASKGKARENIATTSRINKPQNPHRHAARERERRVQTRLHIGKFETHLIVDRGRTIRTVALPAISPDRPAHGFEKNETLRILYEVQMGDYHALMDIHNLLRDFRERGVPVETVLTEIEGIVASRVGSSSDANTND